LLLPPNLDQHTDYGFFSSNLRWDFVTGKHWHHQLSGGGILQPGTYCKPRAKLLCDGSCGRVSADPNAANSVSTAEFCDFPFSLKNRYNRASVNAHSSFLLPNFTGTGGYQYEVENASLQSLDPTSNLFLGPHLRRNNQGGFLDFRYSPHPRATIQFRWARGSKLGVWNRVAPRVGASLALLQGRDFWGETRLRAFYGEGIKEARFARQIAPSTAFRATRP